MSNVRCSPQHLQQVSQVFKNACQQTQEMLRQLASLSQGLQTEWQGPASQRFQHDFQQLQTQVYRSANNLEQMAGSLQQSAARMAEAEQRAGGGGGLAYGGGSGAASVFGGPVLDDSVPEMGGPPSDATPPNDLPPEAPFEESQQPLHTNQSAPEITPQEHHPVAANHPDPPGGFHGPVLEINSIEGADTSAQVFDASGSPSQDNTVIISGELVDMGGKNDQVAAYFETDPDASVGHAPQQAFGSVGLLDRVHPFVQGDGDNCGKTSAAMAINAITGSNLTDFDLPEGCSLLSELNRHTQDKGLQWNDVNLNPDNWQKIEAAVGQGLPVVVGLNGEFSHTGRGHIVTIVGIEGDKVTYADPATGSLRETTRQRMLDAEQYPQGSFIMYPSA